MVGTDTVFFQMIFTILLVIILFAFIFKNGLKEKYGLNKIKISYKEALFFIPIIIIATRNIWFGFSWNMSPSTTAIYVIRMAFVGICEELIFRGFLYKAIEKDNKVEAIVISSLTFAVGHILNLLNGEDLANSIFTVVGAISYGFMFVVLFVCTKSLIPSIIMHSATISTKVKETKSDDYNIYGTNFHTYSAKTYTDGRKSTDLIYLNVGEIEDKTKNVSVAIRLNKSVPYGSTFVNTVENAIKAGDFKDTITLLEDTDNLGNVSKRFGKTVDLNSTIFYQDVIATEIAEKYGLNVRNKDFYLMTDAKYIVYKAYGEDNYLTEVKFVRSTTNYEYTTISSRLEGSAFNYKDAEGNEYSYFADNTKGYLYVFKNQQYVGTLEVTHRIGASQDVFNHVNYIFGIKK